MRSWLLVVGVLAMTQSAELDKRRELHTEAEAIVEESQNLRITTAEARSRVELLLKALRAWSEEFDVSLNPRSRTYNSPARGKGESLTADRCPLFFKEDIEERDEICPLDLTRSEVWGARVVFCRYVCAPKLD